MFGREATEQESKGKGFARRPFRWRVIRWHDPIGFPQLWDRCSAFRPPPKPVTATWRILAGQTDQMLF